MSNLHGCTHGWEDADGSPMECPSCQWSRLNRERDEAITPKVCDKHRENPARVYNPCIGCELDYLRAQIDALTIERDEARQIAVNLYRFLSHHEAVPEICDDFDWLIKAIADHA